MADKFLNLTDLAAIRDWIKGKFATITDLGTKASQADLDALDTKVEGIIAEGGEPNVIESISVNGTSVSPDAQKNVELTVPTLSADATAKEILIEDTNVPSGGDILFTPTFDEATGEVVEGLSVIANNAGGAGVFDIAVPTFDYMENYVDANGGKIDTIQVNGTAQTITNKTVNIPVPTVVSDLTNDSGYQTASDVQSAIASGVASVVKLKGSVANYASLPSTGNQHGDLWNTLDTGKNYVWLVEGGTGAWDDYAGTMDLSAYWTSATGQSNTLEAATVAEINAVLNAS